MKVSELKGLCKERGLALSGRKADLIARLEEVEPEEMEAAEKEEEAAKEAHPPPPPPMIPFDVSQLGPLAKKEQKVHKFVQRYAPRGDLDATLAAIEKFAEESSWLKVAGGDKARILEGVLRPGDRVVEMGTFVGYSSMFMARRLRQLGGGGFVTTLEVDAATAMVARAIIDWAQASKEVRVRVGRGGDWIATGQLGNMDLLNLDHRGTKYHEDLLASESSLAPTGARVMADNVFYPGAPLFLNTLAGRYSTTFHEVKEYLRPDLDDWITLSEPPPIPKGYVEPAEPPEPDDGWGPRRIPRRPGMAPPGPAPPELRQWSAEVDAICWRSLKEDVDWVGFQRHIGPKLRAWKDAQFGEDA